MYLAENLAHPGNSSVFPEALGEQIKDSVFRVVQLFAATTIQGEHIFPDYFRVVWVKFVSNNLPDT